MPRTTVTSRQKEILHFIHDFQESHGYPPTVREIGEGVNLSSSSTVHAHLKAMEVRGLIHRDAVLTRAIRLGPEASKFLTISRSDQPMISLPIIGVVAAGKPRLAVEDVEDYFPLPENFVSGEGYILKVKGDSMIEDGIHEGDLLVVRRQQVAENGDTVVAMIENEATVKNYYREKKRVRLEPANKNMKPIFADEPEILGKVVGLIRRLS